MVRTAPAAGGDGRINVLEGPVPNVRVHGAEGADRSSWGRQGQWPGELEGPDAGLVDLPVGRLVVRDPGHARRVLTAMCWLDPGCLRDGLRIPGTKPAFSGIWTARGGRIWVVRWWFDGRGVSNGAPADRRLITSGQRR